MVLVLVVLTMVLVVVVSYLATSTSDRTASTYYANNLRAKMIAEDGLSAAVTLLETNTKDGNYITAMPAPSPAPTSHVTEIYRPPTADDYLKTTSAQGDVLASRIDAGAKISSTDQTDPRPDPETVTAALGASFGIKPPGFTAADSFDFNQVVRIGNADGRLVNPDALPAFGQWVRVRNANGELIGRYAFFLEDESMKVNVNVAGNRLGSATYPNLRFNDSLLPTPNTRAPSQIQEIDPSALLPNVAATRATGLDSLLALADPGKRLESKGSLALVTGTTGTSPWKDNTNLQNYAPFTTVYSKDDLTTARGWRRMNLNDVVAQAGATNAGKVAAAHQIADWIRDAWTGPAPLAGLQQYQVYGDDRLRLQLAANIVDYIDSDSIPTDCGDVAPGPGLPPLPVIGIEKIPYLVECDVIYKSDVATPAGAGKAKLSVSFRLNFDNLFDTNLALGASIGKIEITGIPAVIKNSSVPIFDQGTKKFTIPVNGTNGIKSLDIPWGPDNVANGVAGVKTFTTPVVFTQDVTYTPGGTITRFEAGALDVQVFGINGERLDSTRMALRDLNAKWSNASSNAISEDFLEQHRSASAMCATYEAVVQPSGSIRTLSFGDPRYRAQVMTKRWYNLTRTDVTRFPTSDDQAELDARAYAVDWYDYIGDRPFLVHRNGPMLSIGELGNVSVCEYPWRTVYLQYAGRPENTVEPAVVARVQERRGSAPAAAANPALLPQDYALLDLFTTSPDPIRVGSININTQNNLPSAVNQGALASLLYRLPADTDTLFEGSAAATSATQKLVTAVANRRVAVAPATGGGPGVAGSKPPLDNNPRHPFFTAGELASVISQNINQSENSTTTGNGRSRTTNLYSLLRSSPGNKSEWKRSYGSDYQVEEPFRKVSDAITTRGNVFRVLYVGQAIKDLNGNGKFDNPNERLSEFLGEAFVERQAVFASKPTAAGSSTQAMKTVGSDYRILSQRSVTE